MTNAALILALSAGTYACDKKSKSHDDKKPQDQVEQPANPKPNENPKAPKGPAGQSPVEVITSINPGKSADQKQPEENVQTADQKQPEENAQTADQKQPEDPASKIYKHVIGKWKVCYELGDSKVVEEWNLNAEGKFNIKSYRNLENKCEILSADHHIEFKGRYETKKISGTDKISLFIKGITRENEYRYTINSFDDQNLKVSAAADEYNLERFDPIVGEYVFCSNSGLSERLSFLSTNEFRMDYFHTNGECGKLGAAVEGEEVITTTFTIKTSASNTYEYFLFGKPVAGVDSSEFKLGENRLSMKWGANTANYIKIK